MPLLASKLLETGERLLVVAREEALRTALSQALWERSGSFLANGMAGEPDAERQPILLSETCDPTNGAKMICLADGEWRQGAEGFERAFLLFGPERTEAARDLWRSLSSGDAEMHIHKQTERGWREGA